MNKVCCVRYVPHAWEKRAIITMPTAINNNFKIESYANAVLVRWQSDE